MTVQDLIQKLEAVDLWITLSLLLAPPLIAGLLGVVHRKRYGRVGGWRYAYSGLVYWTSLPGVLACILTAYHLFFIRRNLLQVNVIVYFLPIAAMIATLVLVRRTVDWDDLPGVDRLFAFMTLIAVSMIAALMILKTRIWIFFGGSIFMLLIIVLVLYLVLKTAFNRFTRGRRSRRDHPVYKDFREKMDRANRAEGDLRRMKRKMKID